MYVNEIGVVKGEIKLNEDAKIQNRVRKSYKLSIKETMKYLTYESIEGIQANGMFVETLCFMDDIAMIANGEENIGIMLRNIDQRL